MNNSDITKFLKTQKAIADSYTAAIESAAKRSGITKQEADVLVFFFNNPEYSLASDAVKMRGFSKAYASKAIEQLLNNGLIEITCEGNELTALDLSQNTRLEWLNCSSNAFASIDVSANTKGLGKCSKTPSQQEYITTAPANLQ